MIIIFLTNVVETFINMWSHLLVNDKNELSIQSIIVGFVKLSSHTSLKKDRN